MSTKVGAILFSVVRKFLQNEVIVKNGVPRKTNKQLALKSHSEELPLENRLQPYTYSRTDETIQHNKATIRKLVQWIQQEKKSSIWKIPEITKEDENHLTDLLTRRNIDLCDIYSSPRVPTRYDEMNTSDNFNDQILKTILECFSTYLQNRYIKAPNKKGSDKIKLAQKFNKISLYVNDERKDENPFSCALLPTVNHTKKSNKKSSVGKSVQRDPKEKETIEARSSKSSPLTKSLQKLAISSKQMIKVFQKNKVLRKDDENIRFDQLSLEIDMMPNASLLTARFMGTAENKTKFIGMGSGISFL